MNTQDVKYLVSTTPERTIMMCSNDVKTLLVLENPVQLSGPSGYKPRTEYTTIQIIRI